MYKLLVVDDERIITDLLAELFQHRKEFDLDVYKAYSGREAMDILEQFKIDIVLTDITMPGMTGLALQAEAVKLWPRCRFIFLTAYDQFDYIQSAMRNQAVDFILKSENDEVLLRSVQRAIDAIEKDNLAEEYHSRTESYIAALPALQQMLFEDVFDGSIDESQMQKMFESCKVDLDCGRPVLLLVGRADKCESGKFRRYVYAVSKLSREILVCKVFAFFYEERYIIWLMQPQDENGEREVIRIAQGNIDRLQQVCRNIFGVSVSVILDSRFVNWSEIVGSYIALSKKLDRFLGLSHEIAIQENDDSSDEEAKKNGQTDDYMLNHILKRISFMRLFLESAQQDEFYDSFDAVAFELMRYVKAQDGAARTSGISDDALTEILLQMNLMFYNIIRRNEIAHEIDEFYPLSGLTHVDIKPAISLIEDRLAGYRKIAEYIFQKHDRQKLRNMNVIFGKLRHYIHENLSADLSLNKLSQIVHFNPYYLSRLFKTVIDKSISEYIGEVRLGRACELLKDTDLLVSDISVAVGYENQQNFTRFFKRHTNMSPLEYRETSKSPASEVKKR